MASLGRYLPVNGAEEDSVEALEDGRRTSHSPLQASLLGFHRVSCVWTDKSQNWEAVRRRRRQQLLHGLSVSLAAVSIVALCAMLFGERSRQPSSAVQVASTSARSAVDRAPEDEARAIRAGYLRAGFSAARAKALAEVPYSLSAHSHSKSVARNPAEPHIQHADHEENNLMHNIFSSRNATRTTSLYRSRRGSYDPRTGVLFSHGRCA